MDNRAKRVEEVAFKVFWFGPMVSVLLFGLGSSISSAGVDPEFEYPGALELIAFGIFIGSFLAGIVSFFAWLAQWSARHQAKQ